MTAAQSGASNLGVAVFIERRDRTASAASDVSAPAAPGVPACPRVLIVEDEWVIAAANAAVLCDSACAVVGTAGTAEDALRLAQDLRPDLVLMDVDLRGRRTGIDAAIDIRARLGIPSLFLTGRSDAATQRRAAPARPLGWLTKPCSGEALAAAVHDAFRSLGSAAVAAG